MPGGNGNGDVDTRPKASRDHTAHSAAAATTTTNNNNTQHSRTVVAFVFAQLCAEGGFHGAAESGLNVHCESRNKI